MTPAEGVRAFGCGVRLLPDGRLRFEADAADACRRIDSAIEALARATGAVPLTPSSTVAGATLETADYFDAFPGGAIPADAAGGDYVAPAACYHVYAGLRGVRLESARLQTLLSACGRRETREPGDLGRLQHFRMREVVFIGPPSWVTATRDEWIGRAAGLASSLGLQGDMEPATDVFYGAAGRGRQLMQQLKGLKVELRMDAGGAGRQAVASFNLHETFFTSRFDIRMADGSAIASGCAAFGIERWTLAYLAQRHACL